MWLSWLATPEIPGSNPVISKFLQKNYFLTTNIETTKIKKKGTGNDPFLTFNVSVSLKLPSAFSAFPTPCKKVVRMPWPAEYKVMLYLKPN